MFYQIIKRNIGYEKRYAIKREYFILKKILTRDVLYFRMPKVASESIVNSFGYDYAFIPHSYSRLYVKTLLILNDKKFRFTFVRHPILRFVSAYNWACRKEIDPIIYPHDIAQQRAILAAGTPNEFCFSLKDMLKSRSIKMIHFYPQFSWISTKKKLLVDFVGRLENLDEDILKLRENYGVILNVSFGPNRKNNSLIRTGDPQAAADSLGLSNRAIKEIEKVYAEDFNNFKYDTTNK